MAMDDAQSQHHKEQEHPMLSLAHLAPEVRDRLDQYTLDGVIDGTRERWLWASMRARSATFLDRSGYVVRFPKWSHQPPQIAGERLCERAGRYRGVHLSRMSADNSAATRDTDIRSLKQPYNIRPIC